MENTQRALRTWMASGRDQDIDDTVQRIVSGVTTLLNVVKALGEYLTAEEDAVRTKGVECLSLVIKRTPPESMNRQSVRVLVSFYISKLEDTETVIPALDGLLALTSLPTFTSVDATEVIKALFLHIKMKSLVQSVRLSVYSIVDTIMARHRDALKSISTEFLQGYISLVEGEKDPRNLMVIFAVDRVIGVEFDISSCTESLFDTIFCYFPITFRPPPDDPYGITSDDLRIALRACLNSTPAFGPMAIPLFLEKLTAGAPPTKRDTLQSLSACLPVYGAALTRANGKKLWNSLRLEIFQPTDPLTEEEGLKTLQTLIKTIYTVEAGDSLEADVQGLAKEICDECLKLLREPEKSQATPAVKTIAAFLSTTPHIRRFALAQAVPHLLSVFADPDEVANRAATLTHLADLTRATMEFTVAQSETSDPPILTHYKDEVLGAFATGLKTPSSSVPSLSGLRSLVASKGLLTNEELGYVVHNVNEVIQVDGDEDVNDAALDLLSAISAFAPRHVEELTLPLLFSSLPDTAPARAASAERERCWRVLASLSRICRPPPLFETLVIRLTAKVDLVIASLSDSTAVADADSEPARAYAHSLLHTLAAVLALKVAGEDADVPKYIDRLVPHLYALFFSSALSATPASSVAQDQKLVAVAAQIISAVVQTLPAQKQESFCAQLFPAFLKGDIHPFSQTYQKFPEGVAFMPFEPSATPSQKALVPLLTAAIVPLRKDAKIPVEDLSMFLITLLAWSLHQAQGSAQLIASCQIIASVVNKRVEDVASFLAHTSDVFWPYEIAATSASAPGRQRAITAWSHISKALLVRNHPSGTNYAERLFDLFQDANTDIAWAAARALGEIGGTDNVLTKKNHAVIRMLVAQKYCSVVLPRLIAGTQKSADSRGQTSHLVALASLIKAVPKAVYVDQMSTLLPLLLRGLDLPDFEIRASVIDTLFASASAATTDTKSAEKTTIAEHASTLVSSMLANCKVDAVPAVRVRVAALRYLGLLPAVVRYDVLHPQKLTVVRELSKVLDDPKKAVRRAAVDARSNWFTFGG